MYSCICAFDSKRASNVIQAQGSKVSVIAPLSNAQFEGDPGLDVTTRLCSSFAASPPPPFSVLSPLHYI